MNTEIRNQAEFLGYEISDWDIDQIKEKYFYFLHRNGKVWVGGIRSAIKQHFS